MTEGEIRQVIARELRERALVLDGLSSSPTIHELGVIKGHRMAAWFVYEQWLRNRGRRAIDPVVVSSSQSQ